MEMNEDNHQSSDDEFHDCETEVDVLAQNVEAELKVEESITETVLGESQNTICDKLEDGKFEGSDRKTRVRIMKVRPLSRVGMVKLPRSLPFSPENPLGPPPHHGGHPPPGSPAAGALAVYSRAAAAAASIPSPLAQQLPAYDIKHTIPLNLASDPRLWNRDDVMTFMQWCEKEFGLPSFETERFQMNGKALCLLTKADLESRAPCSGDVIHNALQILMSSSPSESPLTPHTPSSLCMHPLSGEGNSNGTTAQSTATNSNNDGGEYINNGIILWDFLQKLLNDPAQRYRSFITWKNVETESFKIDDPPAVTRLWGIQTKNLSMNYGKLSRALRHYYGLNTLRKVKGERYCYQFLRNPCELKSIKNISMLGKVRHQNSPISLTIKGEPSNFVESEYENLSMLRHQTSPVSLTRKASPPSAYNDNDYESMSMLRQTQSSPMSLTTKPSSSSYVDHDDEDDQPVQPCKDGAKQFH